MSVTIALQLLERDPARPWVVVRETRETFETDSPHLFWAAAQQRWPPDRFTVVPDTGQGV